MIRSVRFALTTALIATAVAACSAPSPSTVTPAPAAAGPDELTPAEVAFVDQVATIAPVLAENPERLARRGGNSCTDLERTGEDEQVLANAVERFSGGSYTVSPQEAEQILAAASQTMCAD